MSNNDKPSGDGNGPKIDWGAQIKNTLLMLVAIVAFFMLMRYFGLRS
jgi:hypothetical protein